MPTAPSPRLLPSCARRWPTAGRWALLLLVLVVALQAWAWDRNRMLAAAQRLGPKAVAGAQALQGLLGQMRTAEVRAKLNGVNNFFNQQIYFQPDQAVWGQEDYWASPLESLAKGAGDCEDYAIAKYFSLLALDVPMARLRLVYVRAALDGMTQAHMVLAYYATPDAEPLILDNLALEIVPASRRPDLTPVFSFNSEGLWQGVSETQAGGTPTERLSRWRDVLARTAAQGF